jgi:ribosome recycling factor
MNITEKLKKATKDLLTEDVLKEIEESFNKAVDDKVTVNVESALAKQDDDHD